MEIMGFTLSNPFELVDDDPSKYILAIDMGKYVGKEVTMLIYFIFPMLPAITHFIGTASIG